MKNFEVVGLVALVATLMMGSRPAQAQLAVGADGNFAFGSDEKKLGGGFDLRLGYRLGLPRSWHFHTVIIQPEIIAGYLNLPDLLPSRHYEAGPPRLGSRLGFLLPTGSLQLDTEILGYFHLSGLGPQGLGWFVDYGGAIEGRVDWFSFGGHVSYQNLSTAGGWVHWWQVGPHFEFRFD